jgi:hypothetical protein
MSICFMEGFRHRVIWHRGPKRVRQDRQRRKGVSGLSAAVPRQGVNG